MTGAASGLPEALTDSRTMRADFGMRSALAVPENAVVCAGRVFLALRKSGRMPPGRKPVFHAVTPYCRISLCADEPGAASAWAEPPAERITCMLCLRRLERLRRAA